MKKIYFVLLLSFLLSSSGIIAQIPNNSFEDWTSMGTYEIPQQWGTLNDYTASFNVFTATKGTPGNPGNSYLNLTSKALSTGVVVPGFAISGALDPVTLAPLSGFPFTQRPQKLTGKWQFMAYGPEAGFIAVYLTKWNSNLSRRDTVALRKYALPGMVMSWATFNITLNYLTGDNPDTAVIILSSSGPSPYVDSYLYVDNITFSGTVAGITEHSIPERLEIMTNPSNESFTFHCNLSGLYNSRITLLNITGQTLETLTPDTSGPDFISSFKTVNLMKGVYFIRLQSGTYSEVRKVILL